MEGIVPEELIEIAEKMNIKVIDIDPYSMTSYCNLPKIKKHKDPFDRIIIWYCIKNSYILLSEDKKFVEYEEFGLTTI